MTTQFWNPNHRDIRFMQSFVCGRQRDEVKLEVAENEHLCTRVADDNSLDSRSFHFVSLSVNLFKNMIMSVKFPLHDS